MDAILITGPTASGKSALALSLAKQHGGVVINADSMQVYDTLRLLTARPSEAEMEGVEHRLYGHVPAGIAHSAGQWLREVAPVLEALRGQGRLPVFVGGTGLYFQALTGGLSDMPPVPEDIRSKLRADLIELGPEILHQRLQAVDSQMAQSLRPGDGQRIVRALEIFETTGRSISQFQSKPGSGLVDPARARKIVVLPERPVLHQRINSRFETMMQGGAVAEVEALLAQRLDPALPVMKAIGVSQIAAMLAGEMTRAEAIERASAATRQYAKRQMTWFRNQMDESWERIG